MEKQEHTLRRNQIIFALKIKSKIKLVLFLLSTITKEDGTADISENMPAIVGLTKNNVSNSINTADKKLGFFSRKDNVITWNPPFSGETL